VQTEDQQSQHGIIDFVVVEVHESIPYDTSTKACFSASLFCLYIGVSSVFHPWLRFLSVKVERIESAGPSAPCLLARFFFYGPFGCGWAALETSTTCSSNSAPPKSPTWPATPTKPS
jgi:hypothetical protein